MDCTTTREHLAAWLDAELSPSATTLVERHLDSCASCAALATALSSQQLGPETAPRWTDKPRFWDRMDAAMDAEWARQALAPPSPEHTAPWYRRSVRLPLPAVAAYAAMTLLLALAALSGPSSAPAEATLATTPTSSPSAPTAQLDALGQAMDTGLGSWPVATYTPHRGTF